MNPENTATGAKHDLGKNLAGLPYEDFPLAIIAVAQVGTFGCKKYVRNSWKTVPDLQTRYKDALHRHLLADASGQKLDEESGLPHLAHAAWNILALLQDRIDHGVLQAQPSPNKILQPPAPASAPNSPAGPMYLAMVAENAKLRAELEATKYLKAHSKQATPASPSKYLLTSEEMQAVGDLLAVINGDGGHLLERVGMYNAAKQALQQVRALQAMQAETASHPINRIGNAFYSKQNLAATTLETFTEHADNCGCTACCGKELISTTTTPHTLTK